MALSKSSRILILLTIDSAFFLLELIVGYSVHSLALVADAFHMLNDVLSLLVGLWAVRVANQRSSSSTYTYGWQRAETLGALVNGVFLVALCLSIFLDAIQRFVEPQEVSNPKLVLIVGCFGLASNILGLLLFHDHGHSHGGHGHSHGETEVEAGHTHSHDDAITDPFASEEGNVAAVLPQSVVAELSTAVNISHNNKNNGSSSLGVTRSDEESATAVPTSPKSHRRSLSSTNHRRHGSQSRHRQSLDDIQVHPISFRNEIINASRLGNIESSSSASESDDDHSQVDAPTETSPLLGGARRSSPAKKDGSAATKRRSSELGHSSHKHRQAKSDQQKKGGHSHDLNMRGMFLHVMGDALGNVGVIASALIIWQTNYSWRFYADPLISLVITIIILLSAIPLCMAASRILLQAVPAGISIDDLKQDIEALPGVVSCHHVHVWTLSDTKLIASLHIQVSFDFKGAGSAQYMRLAKAVRTCLHEYGIHSSTIQPEFCLDAEHSHTSTDTLHPEHVKSKTNSTAVSGSRGVSRAASMRSAPDQCLLECDDACGGGVACCAPSKPSSPPPQDH